MLRLKVREKFWENDDTCSFYFEVLDSGTLFYKPGQFLTFVLSFNEQEVRRSYSLCTVPVKDKYPGVTVKRVAGGLVSNYFLNEVKEGDVLESDFPAGVFHPDINTSNQLEYVLVAAGSGITPLYSILQTVLTKEPKSNVVLVYASRNEASIIFKDKLEVLGFQHHDRLKVVHVLSTPSDDWQGFKGRLDGVLLKEIVSELVQMPIKQARFFVCGPDAFMNMAQEAILSGGYEAGQIKKESFETKVLVKSAESREAIPSTSAVKEVEVTYRKVHHTFEVADNETILDAALARGIKLPYSCYSGVCTACIGTCEEGEVDCSESDVLSDSEKKKGYVLLCVGRPATPKVKIRID
jgi:ring-1,2-phenylacetyl-CoA epoxidase subunit PaaE